MSVIVNPVEKSALSNGELLDLMRQTPLAIEAVQKKVAEQEAAKLADRLVIIDSIERGAKEIAAIEKQIAKLQPSVHAAHDEWVGVAAKLSELHQRIQFLQQAESAACGRLGQHGEAVLENAIMAIDGTIRSIASEGETLRGKLSESKSDSFFGERPRDFKKDTLRLAHLREELKRHQVAFNQLNTLRLARIAPKALAARVEEIVAPLREPQQ